MIKILSLSIFLSLGLMAADDISAYKLGVFSSNARVASASIDALTEVDGGYEALYLFVTRPWDKVNSDPTNEQYLTRCKEVLGSIVEYKNVSDFRKKFEEMYAKYKENNGKFDGSGDEDLIFPMLLSIDKNKYRADTIDYVVEHLKSNGEHLSFSDKIFDIIDILIASDPTRNDLYPIIPNLIKGITGFFNQVQIKCATYSNRMMGSSIEISGLNNSSMSDIQDKFREYYYGEYLPKVKAKKTE